MAEKDEWNARPPWDDKRYAKYVNKPELAGLLPVLYPGAFPNLAKYTKPRADLNAVLLTGIPKGVVPGFQNYTGAVEADMLRLNLAIPPTAKPERPRPGRGRRGRLAQRSPGQRRRRDGRAAGGGRPDAPAGRPVVQARRRRQRRRGRDDQHQRGASPTRSRSWGSPVAATRRCPAPLTRRDRPSLGPPTQHRCENPHAGQGSVLLDIGGDVGALVVTMPSSMAGVEIEIAPRRARNTRPRTAIRHEHGHGHSHAHGHRPHVAVVNRPVTAEGAVPSLVFPELVEGSYELFDKGEDAVLLTADIVGGQVTFLDWPGRLSA